jgi:hypothetical protein
LFASPRKIGNISTVLIDELNNENALNGGAIEPTVPTVPTVPSPFPVLVSTILGATLDLALGLLLFASGLLASSRCRVDGGLLLILLPELALEVPMAW